MTFPFTNLCFSWSCVLWWKGQSSQVQSSDFPTSGPQETFFLQISSLITFLIFFSNFYLIFFSLDIQMCLTYTLVFSVIILCFYDHFLKNIYLFIYLFIERGEGREKERERNVSVWLPLTCPSTGDLAHTTQACALAHWIKQVTLWFTGWHSIHWTTSARALLWSFYSLIQAPYVKEGWQWGWWESEFEVEKYW